MLYSFLYNLGVHIGNTKFVLQSYYKPFLLGFKNNYCIFDLHKIIYYLKRAFSLFYFLGVEKAKFLFYFHDLYSTNNILRLFFLKHVEDTRNLLFDERWSYGQLSNMYTSCYILFTDIFNFKENIKNSKNYSLYTRISFYNFFFSLLFYTFYKRVPGMEWETHISRIEKYWRFFLYFKFYIYFNKFPDLFLYFSATNFPIPVIEAKNLKIPVVGNLDVDYSYQSLISYPLYGNSQSHFIYLFYFFVFIQQYKKGIIKHYDSNF
jgi:ribosomal protein S2